MVKLAPGASRVPQDDTPPKGSRLVIEGVTPQVDGGRFPAKGSLGEQVVVEADVLLEGHDRPVARLLHRASSEQAWTEVRMRTIGNDRFRAEFEPSELGSHFFNVEAWIDHFATWAGDLAKRVAAGQDVAVDLLIGAEIVEAATKRAKGPAGTRLKRFARDIRSGAVPGADQALAARAALSSELQTAMEVAPDRAESTRMPRELEVWVDRERARFSTWYELFPRSTGPAGVHGTFADLEKRLRYVARMGFDVLYLPPIHPIGRRFRASKVDRAPGIWKYELGSLGTTFIRRGVLSFSICRRMVSAADSPSSESHVFISSPNGSASAMYSSSTDATGKSISCGRMESMAITPSIPRCRSRAGIAFHSEAQSKDTNTSM